MNTLNRFFIGVLIVLLIVLGGVVLWQRSNSRPSAPVVTSIVSTQAVTHVQSTTTPASRDQLQAALSLKSQKKLVPARDALRQWLSSNSNSDMVPDAEKALSEIDTEIIFTPVPSPEKTDYTIASGDSLDKIAHKFNTTVQLIQKCNRVAGAVIHPGDRLRIYQGKFSVVVDKTANTLTVLDDGKFFKKYSVGTGQYSTTPTGDYKIIDRIPDPPWHKDGKTIPFGDTNNVLGKYWLALNIPGYGIHGTWEPESIGKQSSQGCVRMLNENVEELFLMLPYGTPVTIHE